MNIYLLNSDARNIPLTDQSVQCIITSPPYYGLRDYGTAQWNGGNPMCNHSPAATPQRRGIASSTLGGGKETTGHQHEGYRVTCARCGAVRIDKQIGLERMPQEYVTSIVAVMRECWRVLKDDGVLWLNIGDSYSGAGYSNHENTGGAQRNDGGKQTHTLSSMTGLKPKDLIGIPWRVAFALQDDGWYLRSDIIWSKPNPMPESVTDRPTKAHEYIFMLTKRARYYYDAEAIKEDSTDPIGSAKRYKAPFFIGDKHESGGYSANGAKHTAGMKEFNGTRNRRSVWTVATTPYSGAHFATFPPKLIEPMVLAGSRPGDLILDPFAGTATVGRVAIKHQRRFVGLDLNLKYIGDLAHERTSKVQIQMTFNEARS